MLVAFGWINYDRSRDPLSSDDIPVEVTYDISKSVQQMAPGIDRLTEVTYNDLQSELQWQSTFVDVLPTDNCHGFLPQRAPGVASTILIVEDDVRTAQYVAQGLMQEGYAVRITHTGDDALRVAGAQEIDLIILDVMLPKLDGLGVVQRLRQHGQQIPVLMLTARDAVSDRVKGLEAGADDYLTKPFAFEELVARVRALLRRSNPPAPLRRSVGDLEINFETRRVTRGGKAIELTPREFDLVAYLVCHAGEIVDRARLARDVWRMTDQATPIDNVIDVYVSRVRRKIDEGHAVKLVHVVRGLGVTLSVEAPTL